jgi:hypothetical protein
MNETSVQSVGESVWKRLRHGNIATCEEALKFLVDLEGNVHLSWLDQDLTHRFFREFEDRSILPPVIPLLLWRNCFYIGSPKPLTDEHIKLISDRTLTDIKTLKISTTSYRTWFRRQNIPNPNEIHSAQSINPLTGETEQVDIVEATDLYLSQAVDSDKTN